MSQYDIDLLEYWRILKKRKAIILFFSIALGVFSTIFTVLRAPTPLFTSVCSIKFEKVSTVEGLYDKTISWSEEEDIETQISTIKSYFVFKKVAEKLGLISPMDFEKDGQLKSSMVGVIGSLQSKVRVTRESIRVGATRERFTNILNITVSDKNPVFSQKLANTIALTYKKLHTEQQMKRTTEALKYIDNQLKEVRKKLHESEEEFNRFTQRNQLISFDMQSENLLSRSQKIQVEKLQLQEEDRKELVSTLLRLSQFMENFTGSDHIFYTTKGNSQYHTTNDNLVELMLNKETLLKDYTLRHPEVVAISRKIMENARKMSILLRLQISAIDNKVINLAKELEMIGRKTNVLMDKKLEYNRLKRKVELFNNMTALLEQKNQEALIRKAEKPEEITIIKPALLPTQPVNIPKTTTKAAMGVIIGLVLGLVVAFVLETFDTSLSAIEEVEETLATQVLGVIPQADAKDIQEGLKEKYPAGGEMPSIKQAIYLVSHFAPLSMMAENFRTLRTNIQFKDVEKKIKTISITSTSPQEGKTLVAINLSITMAQAGIKTLLIGSDLRMPMLEKAFGLEKTPGLTDILLGNYQWQKTVQSVTDVVMGKMTWTQVMMTSGLDNLHLITTGSIPPNPADLIESKRLMDFIEEVKKEFDLIIFDSTPILSAADAAILGTKVDGVLLVYRLGNVSRGLLKRSTTQLRQVNCNIMGVILNGMKPEVSPDFHQDKYYKYHYSYGKGPKYKRDQKPKKGFSFFRKREGGKEAGRQKVLAKKLQKGPTEQENKHHKLKLTLMWVAFAFLGVGILLQHGLWGAFKGVELKKPVKEKTIKNSVKKRISKPAGTEKAEAISVKPKAKGSSGKAGIGAETLSPPTPPVAKIRVKIETPASSEKASSHPYSIQLGSFHTLKRAKKAISIYSKKGLSPYWVKVELSKGIWYRVFTGHFEDREQAERFRLEHGLTEAEVKKTEYANLIGNYSDADELEKQIKSLKNHGYSPYVIKDRDGRYRLFVGAFFPKRRAERQYHDLKSSGIQSQVVKR